MNKVAVRERVKILNEYKLVLTIHFDIKVAIVLKIIPIFSESNEFSKMTKSYQVLLFN